jgi:hypothetical protein
MNDPTSNEDMVPTKRPIRLWLAGVLNIFVGGLSVLLIAFMASSARVPEPLQLSASSALLSSLGGTFLIFSSVVALMGRPSGPRLMLLAALAFFGPIIAQNAWLLMSGSQTVVPSQKLAANVFRHSLYLAFNVWVLRSLLTRQFFSSRAKV